jgi:hypothetical protein
MRFLFTGRVNFVTFRSRRAHERDVAEFRRLAARSPCAAGKKVLASLAPAL